MAKVHTYDMSSATVPIGMTFSGGYHLRLLEIDIHGCALFEDKSGNTLQIIRMDGGGKIEWDISWQIDDAPINLDRIAETLRKGHSASLGYETIWFEDDDTEADYEANMTNAQDHLRHALEYLNKAHANGIASDVSRTLLRMSARPHALRLE